jgi:hypothetical protein
MRSVFNIGMGIESGQVRIEKLSYFFQQTIVLTLSNCKDIEESVAVNMMYNTISAGYDKFDPVGSVAGMNEYNTKSQFTNIIKSIKKDLSIVSPYRADDAGIGKARLTGKTGTDINTDEGNYLLSVVRDGSDVITRTMEGFDSITGTVSDEGGYNVMYSPSRNLRRHGHVLSAFLKLYPTSEIVYTHQERNSQLISQETGGDLITETDDILVSALEAPIWETTKYTFETPIRTTDIDTLEDDTGGIPNIYGVVKFRQNAEDPIWKYGWILSMRVKDDGVTSTAKFELLKVDPVIALTFELS